MDKVSDKLFALVESQEPEKEVKLNVLLRRGLDRASVATLADELASLAQGHAPVEILHASGIILMKGTLGAVERIASHHAVQWVDQDTESSIEDLVDG